MEDKKTTIKEKVEMFNLLETFGKMGRALILFEVIEAQYPEVVKEVEEIIEQRENKKRAEDG